MQNIIVEIQGEAIDESTEHAEDVPDICDVPTTNVETAPNEDRAFLTPILGDWKDNEAEVGTLSDMGLDRYILQVMDVIMSNDTPTGEIVLHDMEYYIKCQLKDCYRDQLRKGVSGPNSVLDICSTSGFHNQLFIVSILFSLKRAYKETFKIKKIADIQTLAE